MRATLPAGLSLLALSAPFATSVAAPTSVESTPGATTFAVPTTGLYDIGAIGADSGNGSDGGVIGSDAGTSIDATDLGRVVLLGFEAGDGSVTAIPLPTIPTPEPMSLALLGAGLLGLGLLRRRWSH